MIGRCIESWATRDARCRGVLESNFYHAPKATLSRSLQCGERMFLDWPQACPSRCGRDTGFKTDWLSILAHRLGRCFKDLNHPEPSPPVCNRPLVILNASGKVLDFRE